MMMSEKLASLRCSNSKAFWNLLKEGFGANKIGNIDMKDWAAHFSSLLSSYEEVPNSDFEERHIKVDELDKEFSIQEIREAIFYHLKCHKASGPDGVLNEVLKWSLEWTQNVILLLFNQLWRSEIYPANWNEVFLLPIHKNGSYKDPNNYRGIAITSCLGKLFCILINKRLYNWVEKNQKLSRWQGGFRRRMGCDVQSFRLLATILHQFSQKKGYKGRKQGRVFACFVDFKKAYDSVKHALLWKKLQQIGISTKILNLLKDMYRNISCRVKVKGSLSDEFTYSIGVRQGCVLSPLLFNLFINDVAELVEKEKCGGFCRCAYCKS